MPVAAEEAEGGAEAGRTSVFAEPRRRRRELSRQAVVEAALAILDGEGEDALTFRHLAAELGTGVSSLYWHVPGREALMDLALDQVAGAVWAAIPSRGALSQGPDGWRRDLREAALALYLGLSQRPWAGRQQLVSSDRGPNQLRVWDHLGRICFAAGLDERDAFHAMTAVLSFVLGYVSQETAPTSPDVDRATYLEDTGSFMDTLDAAEFPAVRRLVPVFVAHDQRTQFEAGLDLLLEGLAVQVAQARGPDVGRK